MKKSTLISCSRSLLLGGLFILGQFSSFAKESSLKNGINSSFASVNSVAYNGTPSLDSISKAVLSPNSISVQFVNDPEYPWGINGSQLESGNKGVAKSTSSLKFSYTSNYKTQVTYYAWKNNNSYHILNTYVDGRFLNERSTSKKMERFYLPEGKHLIEVKDSISSVYSWSGEQYGCFSDLCVKEILPLEEAILSAQSKPLKFTNDDKFPWTIEDGYIQNTNYGHEKTSSRFSTTFTIDKPHKFSFETYVGNVEGWSGYENYHHLKFYINDVCYQLFENDNHYQKSKVLLEPGTYKLEWIDSLENDYYDFRTKIKNIELSENWVEVNVSLPGTLGVEVLKQVNVLTDVELLRIKGELNEVDWEKIGQMNQLIGLDLSQCKLKYIPNHGFSNLEWLSSVKLPEGLETIGANSFEGTQIRHLDVPASVVSIEQEAFRKSRTLEKIKFKDESQLKYIGYQAFYSCKKLKEFIMPNTVKYLRTQNDDYNNNSETFAYCSSLQNIVFSDSLIRLPSSTCYNCENLKSVNLPKNLTTIESYCFYNSKNLSQIDFPKSIYEIGDYSFYSSGIHSLILPSELTYLGQSTFENCSKVRFVVLPSSVIEYDGTFENCTSLDSIVLYAVVPPVITTNDPFKGVSKSGITLLVPPLGTKSYKLDTYWYQFGNIQTLDTWCGDIFIANKKYELFLPDELPMDWKPNVYIWNCLGRFDLYGKSTLSAKTYRMYSHYGKDDDLYNERESDPYHYNWCSSFINNATMRADEVCTSFRIGDDYWTFMSVPYTVDHIDINKHVGYTVRTYSGEARSKGKMNETWYNVQSWDNLSPYSGFIIHSDTPDAYDTYFQLFAKDNEFKNNIFASTDVQIDLKEYVSEFAHNRSWNFIGNPYPSYYDTRAMDFTAPITVWDSYHRNYAAYSPIDDSYILRPFEAFFIQKPIDVDKITFSKDGRQHDRAVRNNVAYVGTKCFANGSAEPRRVFNLTLTSANGQVDRTRFVMNDAASRDYEMHCDANKFKSVDNEAAQLFTVENGVEFSINERPMDDGIVKLGVQIGASGFFEIALTGICDAEVTLYDKKMNKKINLNQGSYRFNAESGADLMRFEVHLGNDITGVDSISSEQRKDDIYDLQGRKVKAVSSKGVFIVNGKKVIK